jgi:hypothetical protein
LPFQRSLAAVARVFTRGSREGQARPVKPAGVCVRMCMCTERGAQASVRLPEHELPPGGCAPGGWCTAWQPSKASSSPEPLSAHHPAQSPPGVTYNAYAWLHAQSPSLASRHLSQFDSPSDPGKQGCSAPCTHRPTWGLCRTTHPVIRNSMSFLCHADMQHWV